MMEGSSLRRMVGMYSALGTLEEMSWEQQGGHSVPWPPGSQWAAGAPMRPPSPLLSSLQQLCGASP